MFRWTIEGADFYVDGKDGQDSFPGTREFPLKTVEKAAALCTTPLQKIAIRGDIVYSGLFGSRHNLEFIGDGYFILDGNNIKNLSFKSSDIVRNGLFVNGNAKSLSLMGVGVQFHNCIIDGWGVLGTNYAMTRCVYVNGAYVHSGGGFVGSLEAKQCVILNNTVNRSSVISGHSNYCQYGAGIANSINNIGSLSTVQVPVPKFADPARWNYHLLPDSPLIGQGMYDALSEFRYDCGIGGVCVNLGPGSLEMQEPLAVFSKTGALNDVYVQDGKWYLRNSVNTGYIESSIIDLISPYRIDSFLKSFSATYTSGIPDGGMPSLMLKYGNTATEVGVCPWATVQYNRAVLVDAAGLSNGDASYSVLGAKNILPKFVKIRVYFSRTDF